MLGVTTFNGLWTIKNSQTNGTLKPQFLLLVWKCNRSWEPQSWDHHHVRFLIADVRWGYLNFNNCVAIFQSCWFFRFSSINFNCSFLISYGGSYLNRRARKRNKSRIICDVGSKIWRKKANGKFEFGERHITCRQPRNVNEIIFDCASIFCSYFYFNGSNFSFFERYRLSTTTSL